MDGQEGSPSIDVRISRIRPKIVLMIPELAPHPQEPWRSKAYCLFCRSKPNELHSSCAFYGGMLLISATVSLLALLSIHLIKRRGAPRTIDPERIASGTLRLIGGQTSKSHWTNAERLRADAPGQATNRRCRLELKAPEEAGILIFWAVGDRFDPRGRCWSQNPVALI